MTPRAGRAGTGGLLRSIGGLLALGGLAAGVAAVWAMTPAPPDARAGTPATAWTATDTAVVEAGRGLYTANCASCHGAQGEGADNGPPLAGVGAASADFYLRTGRMPLSAPGQQVVRQDPVFDEAEIQALVAYVASLGDGPEIPQVQGGGDIREGWELFQANCAACHNATGAGNAIGGGFVAVGLGESDPVQVAEATIIGPGAMPAFAFTEEQLAAVAAYVAWLAEAPTPGGAAIGQTGPVAEGFVAVAVGLPLLLLVSLFVARHGRAPDDRGRTPAERGDRRGVRRDDAAPLEDEA